MQKAFTAQPGVKNSNSLARESGQENTKRQEEREKNKIILKTFVSSQLASYTATSDHIYPT